MITTMRQICDYTGYSATTVSRVFQGSPLVTEEARDYIFRAAMELGYTGDPGVVIPDISETDKAWLAGLFDGEGCFVIARCLPGGHMTHRTVQYRPHVTITMGHKPTIDRVSSLFNFGSGKVYRLSKNPRWNDAYKWYAGCRQAIAATQIMRPYLVTKADEADIIIEFSKLPNLRTGRAGIPKVLLDARELLFNKINSLKPKNNTEHARTIVSNMEHQYRTG